MTHLNEYGRITRLALRHAKDAFKSQAELSGTWKALNYHAEPDFMAACREYDAFAQLFVDLGATIEWLPADATLSADSIYVRDASLLAPGGLIDGAMGKAARKVENAANGKALSARGVKIAGAVAAPGTVEGGDVVWLDDKTFVIGEGYRTNAAGITQMKAILGPEIEVQVVPLPHYKGPSDVFHLMSMLSPHDHDLALVYSPLMPVPFRNWLLARGVKLVEVPNEEFESMGCNVLALSPRNLVMVEGNHETRRRLEAAGCQVVTYAGQNISRLGEGGPTCLTRPLERA